MLGHVPHPPLRRHPSLQPLSRDHHAGLVAAHRLLKATEAAEEQRRAAAEYFLEAWRADIAPHFAEEEELLPPLIRDPLQVYRMRDEHTVIRDLARRIKAHADSPSAAVLEALGRKLEVHIRWEERELFPAIERDMTQEDIADLEHRMSAWLGRPH